MTARPADVANAIAEHYAPRRPQRHLPDRRRLRRGGARRQDRHPRRLLGVGEKPTGRKDPFALRRAALGIIRLILENGLRCPLHASFETRHRRLRGSRREARCRGGAPRSAGLHRRPAEGALREKGVRHDLIAAVFALKLADGRHEDDLVRLLARVDALAAFLGTEDGANLLIASQRAGNIVRIEEKKDSTAYDAALDPALLHLPEEQRLVEAMNEARAKRRSLPRSARISPARWRHWRGCAARLMNSSTRSPSIAMTPARRENRLRLLSRIRATLNQVADFSQIEG